MVKSQFAGALSLALTLTLSSISIAPSAFAAGETTVAQNTTAPNANGTAPNSTPPAPPPAPDAAKKAKAEAEAAKIKADAAKTAAATFQGFFRAEVLGGGTQNDLRVPQPLNRLGELTPTLTWEKIDNGRYCTKKPGPDEVPELKDISIDSRASDKDDANKSIFGVSIAPPPCLWPLMQRAHITITAMIDGKSSELLIDVTLPVSTLWFPTIVTLAVLLLIYPGGAMASWLVSQRRHQMDAEKAEESGNSAGLKEPPSFWAALDPVELTKNPYGRGSIAKLQIFVFSFIVFGLLLFNVLRTGLLANMSPDVLYLMGISAVGAVGGRMTYVARRRLKLDNWAWLRRKKWLPREGDIAPRARWADLFTDSGGKEFDPYRFQMAVFSVVVALALIKTSATSLEAFTIPTTLLTLLGLSHTVFIAGQGTDNGGYQELDDKLDSVRKHERKYFDAKSQLDAAMVRAKALGVSYPPPISGGTTVMGDPAKLAKQDDVDAELNAFTSDVAQAEEMFWAVYGPQLGEMTPEFKNASNLLPSLN